MENHHFHRLRRISGCCLYEGPQFVTEPLISASLSPLLPDRRERHPGRGGDQLQQVHAPEVGGVRVYLVTRHVSSTDESRGRLQPPTQHAARGTCISSSLRTRQTATVLHFNPDDTLVINIRIKKDCGVVESVQCL